MSDSFMDENESIDLSPLIDIVFILLIFFMVTTTFVKDYEVELDRPQAQSSQVVSEETLKVQINANSDIYFRGDLVSEWALQALLKKEFVHSKTKSVLVVPDASVPSQELIRVIDYCRLAGAEQVTVATSKEV